MKTFFKKITIVLLHCYCFFLAWIAFAFLFCFFSGIRVAYSVGPSMKPTLASEELEYSKKTAIDKINRFDIIFFLHDGEIFEKRVLGLPGETVTLDHNDLYVNDQLIEQPFEFYAVNDEMNNYVWTYTLSENEFFCVGDNRVNSNDCRFFGPIKDTQIIDRRIESVSNNKVVNFLVKKPIEIVSPIIKFSFLCKKWITENYDFLPF